MGTGIPKVPRGTLAAAEMATITVICRLCTFHWSFPRTVTLMVTVRPETVTS